MHFFPHCWRDAARFLWFPHPWALMDGSRSPRASRISYPLKAIISTMFAMISSPPHLSIAAPKGHVWGDLRWGSSSKNGAPVRTACDAVEQRRTKPTRAAELAPFLHSQLAEQARDRSRPRGFNFSCASPRSSPTSVQENKPSDSDSQRAPFGAGTDDNTRSFPCGGILTAAPPARR